MKIFVIEPMLSHRASEEVTTKELKAAARSDTEIFVKSIRKGPASIECMHAWVR